MMTSFYNLLKYAATGIASPDMTYYDKLRASTLMGGAVQTLTGQPPLSFPSDGSPLISWSMKGNGSQTGTPTPDNPVMPTFCGVRTSNILEYYIDAIISASGSVERASTYQTYFAPVTAGQTYTFGANIDVYGFFETKPAMGTVAIDGERHFPGSGRNVTIPDGVTWLGCRVRTGADAMLNTGRTALPYEPFGWAEKITCAGQTTPVYLGQVSTVRRIKCVDLGTLTYTKTGSGNFSATLGNGKVVGNSEIAPAICSHFKVVSANAYGSTPYSLCASINIKSLISINKTGFEEMTATEFKAAMSGVLLWYALATEQTGITNEPLAKIGDYCDELSSTDAGVSIPTANGSNTLTVDTELQPSEMSITYRE